MATFEVTLSSADEAYVREVAASLGVSVPAAVAIVVEEQRCQKLRARKDPPSERPAVPLAEMAKILEEHVEVSPDDPIFDLIGFLPDGGPTDLSVNYKHYLYGFPKR